MSLAHLKAFPPQTPSFHAHQSIVAVATATAAVLVARASSSSARRAPSDGAALLAAPPSGAQRAWAARVQVVQEGLGREDIGALPVGFLSLAFLGSLARRSAFSAWGWRSGFSSFGTN